MRHPEIVWAQHSERVFLTIELPDAKSPVVKIEPQGKLKFSATAGASDEKYEVELELFKEINVEASKISTGARQIFVVIEKAEKMWWPRLIKSEGRAPPYLKVDWNKWVDEDEENEVGGGGGGAEDFELGGLGDLSNFDMGGNEADSDDEETLPDASKKTDTATTLEKTADPEELPDAAKAES
ncbi:uncharacterized protein At3g03773 isoform X4 [Selaginella moellendorffii]|uniref:uncharacterized protein At3g03773 isoform X4 n=1 Tax=Selaginella moellendorffii TaxID=88036 RepID=UPI000D1CDB5D|nr:uncharacterized protein At3g03773 isoform X4 [Selaginella moellendorffii]|eukprot:XP_024521834.1 uncharacterized protein At3g03773 isoform X4 [Selaginella moellendorffii]